MPIITTRDTTSTHNSKNFMPALDCCLHKQQWSCFSRLTVLTFTLVVAAATISSLFSFWKLIQFLVVRRIVRQQEAICGRIIISWTSGLAPLSRNFVPTSTPTLDTVVSSRQGQGPQEKQASCVTVRGGEASGTAPVGLAGPSKKNRRMEEEERYTTAGPWSRGVSTDWIEWQQEEEESSGPLLLPPPPAAAAGPGLRDNARASSSSAPRLVRGTTAGAVAGSAQGRQDRINIATSSLVNYMADDEHIRYGAHGAPGNDNDFIVNRSPSRHQRHRLDFNRPPPPPPLPLPTAGGGHLNHSGSTTASFSGFDARSGSASALSQEGAIMGQTGGHHAEGVPFAYASSDFRSPRTTGAIAFDGHSSHVAFGTEDTFSPSSYPSISPMLPPPPPSIAEDFDPSVVMFPGPGAVVDGGIRIVPPHGHGDGELVHTHGESMEAFGDPSSRDGWRRHTRVYGGDIEHDNEITFPMIDDCWREVL
ncbi:hypothetical protein M406DRAFT_72937 [Cryphonectria parasitica EP155]|uniref:Uncharacterized protein n=1 Tax=Cryphonectria parasitica (strain ATCC 38755 / EP155) TaxID=660469 RepID=A0A9P5CI09_CRYP1|nr:uncharacterized protein M406DRAFT_72937 [Cryphonectria parasitica EP155]KAF3760444.1 hypothetical protein M406DRAFT_72937 [Cryphonectria parasitica EP155]